MRGVTIALPVEPPPKKRYPQSPEKGTNEIRPPEWFHSSSHIHIHIHTDPSTLTYEAVMVGV